MGNEWDDVFAPSDQLAGRLIAQQFPELPSEAIQFLGEGFDCRAYRCGEWVFRFPRRPHAIECLEVELQFLPGLGHQILVGSASPEFPYPFLACRHQAGCPIEQYGGSRTKLAGQLGVFLQRLHSLPIPVGLRPDRLGKLDPTVRNKQIIERLGNRPEWLPTRQPDPREPVVNHGDLYCRHVFVDEAGDFCGLIDWGDLHQGHPGVDLACAWILFDKPDRELFWEAYGESGPELRLWSRFRALNHSLLVRDYATEMGDQRLLSESLRALARIYP